MHKNIKPTLHDGVYICSWKCDHWIEKRHDPCDLMDRTNECCVPWYQNRVEELEAQRDRAIDVVSVPSRR
jgi:hypothetical protein